MISETIISLTLILMITAAIIIIIEIIKMLSFLKDKREKGLNINDIFKNDDPDLWDVEQPITYE